MATKVTTRKGAPVSGKTRGDAEPRVSGKPGGKLQGGSGGSQNKAKNTKSGGGKA